MGATASGKTALAVRLALRLGGEVISADSMQVYRGLAIGTAKPSPEERAGIPHHLIDIADITEKYDVFRFCSDAEKLITEIRSRGKVPVAAGSSTVLTRFLLRNPCGKSWTLSMTMRRISRNCRESCRKKPRRIMRSSTNTAGN